MRANAAYLVAADICGCSEIFKLGGPWAIASMAYGTATVPAVDKIVGPGNKYVIAAKMAVYGTVDIDSPAGPSEVLILADDTANPAWLAADLLAQMEHDPDAASVLVTPSLALAEAVSAEIDARWETLPRREILDSSRRHSAVLVADSLEAALDFANEYAAEHLEIVTADPRALLPRVRHAGSIFLGPYAPVPVGDYASGTNHVLPTGRGARMFSGLSVDEFMKKSTYQVLSAKGLRHLRDAVITLAEAEGLPLHADAVRRRDDA
jgi:histidinol dehydrogenase